uniref:Ig-like domain-containing protein n=1 Tax=Seriola dumerili TaxID=41447 RepID=A0A3B4V1Q1_SERDU
FVMSWVRLIPRYLIDFLLLLRLYLVTKSSGEEMKVKPGEDVTLQCRGPRDAEIKLIKWNRPDLKSEDYVFLYRDKRIYEQYQLPSYRGRVELTDPDMKDGNVSVILKNVTINDAARYECQVGKKGSRPQLISTITLKVVDSGEFVQVNLLVLFSMRAVSFVGSVSPSDLRPERSRYRNAHCFFYQFLLSLESKLTAMWRTVDTCCFMSGHMMFLYVGGA